jgi:hypothetical protein
MTKILKTNKYSQWILWLKQINNDTNLFTTICIKNNRETIAFITCNTQQFVVFAQEKQFNEHSGKVNAVPTIMISKIWVHL